jgi:hypothetical protein
MLKKAMLVGAIFLSALSAKEPDTTEQPKKYSRPVGFQFSAKPSSITLSSALYTGSIIEKNMGHVFDFGMDFLKPEKTWTRCAYELWIYPMLFGPIHKAVRRTYQLYGKAKRIEATGDTPEYFICYDESREHNYFSLLGRNIWYTYLEPFSDHGMHIDVLPKEAEKKDLEEAIGVLMGKNASTTEVSKLIRNKDVFNAYESIMSSRYTTEQRILIEAAEHNSLMQYAKNLEDMLWYDDGAHVAQMTGYMASKWSGVFACIKQMILESHVSQTTLKSTPIGRVESLYNKAGITSSYKLFMGASVLASLLSAETISRLMSDVSFAKTGDTFMPVPEWNGLRLPNFSLYLTSQGPSLFVNTGYKWSKTLFMPISMEYVFLGNAKQIELGIGLRKYFEYCFLHVETILNAQQKAAGGKVLVGLKPFQNFEFLLGVRLDHSQTLEGERNIEKTTDKYSTSFTLGAQYDL